MRSNSNNIQNKLFIKAMQTMSKLGIKNKEQGSLDGKIKTNYEYNFEFFRLFSIQEKLL